MTGQLTHPIHRVLGALIGLLPSAVLLSLDLRGVRPVALMAGLRFATQLLVGRNYGLVL